MVMRKEPLLAPINSVQTRVTKPSATETGAGEEFLKSAARTAGTSAGKKRSAGRSAGSSAAFLCNTGNGTASSTPPGTPLFPGTGPGSPRSTFQEFLSSTRFCGRRLRNPRGIVMKIIISE